MKKTFRTVAWILLLCVVSVLPVIPARAAQEPETVLAERVESGELVNGDRIVIVIEADGLAVSERKTGTRLRSVPVTRRQTASRQVLTAIDQDAAVFAVTFTEGNDILLKCDAGYLTSAAAGNGLYYAGEPEECSVWQIRDGVFLYNPNAVSGTYRNYYLEYYKNYDYFTTYGKSKNTDPAPFTLSFYRMGNSLPEEGLINEGGYALPVFETSDTHGYLADISSEPYAYRLAYISDKVKDVRGYGGHARNDLALLLDGGDIYQGNTMSNLLYGQSLAAAYQIMGYDAVTVGNHEFDWGIENTTDMDGTMTDSSAEGFSVVNSVPVVVSNLYRNGEKVPFARDYVILDKTAVNAEGEELPVRVAVIGFAGEYSSDIMYDRFTGAGYEIRLDYDAVNRLAAELEAEGKCDATILLTHEEASVVAEAVGEGSAIDLVLGGHTHRNLSGTTDRGLWYLEPAGYGAAYGYAELVFSARDGGAAFEKVDRVKTVSVTGSADKLENIPANADELDPEVAALTDKVLDRLNDILTEQIGYITESAERLVYLPGSGKRATTMGNWQGSIIARIGEADAAFVNNGGIRTEFPLGEGEERRFITRSDIYTMFPFENRIFCYALTYEDFLAALEYALTENGRTLFSQIVGVDVYYTDGTVNAIVSPTGAAVYANGEWREGWKDKTIRVAFSEFLATTDRVSYGMHNPFVAWNDTDRLLDDGRIDSEWAYKVLSEEAAANDGHLAVDTKAHFIEGAYGGSVSDKLPAPSSADGLTDAQKPAAVNGLVGSGTDQPLVIPPAGPAPDTYVLMYSADGGLTWSVRIPYGREPGRYTVKAKYVSGLYEDIVLDDILVTVSPAGRPEDRPVGSTAFPLLPHPPFRPTGKTDDLPQSPAAELPAAGTTSLPFTDAEPGTDLYDTVRFVYENGIMNGVSGDKFDPYGTLTRGMAVTILYRMEGSPAIPYTGAFGDVPAGEWYTDGVEWAAANGIVNGYGDGRFGPADEVTREQLAAILYRLADERGFDVSSPALSGEANVSPWAVKAVRWAMAEGIVPERDGAGFAPADAAYRIEAAAAFRAVLAYDRPLVVSGLGCIHETEFGGIYLTLSIEDFLEKGFRYGDTVDVVFSNGYALTALPFYNGYYTRTGDPLLVAYPGYPYIKACVNSGGDLWFEAGADEDCMASVALRERGACLAVQDARSITYSDERDDYDSDAEFANFREIPSLKGVFRGASPCDNQHGRAGTADSLLRRYGIAAVIDLADTEEKIEGYLSRPDFASDHFLSLYRGGKVVPLAMNMNYASEDFRDKAVRGLRAMIGLPGPYYVHCTEGKDRTGFFCMLLEAVSGASYEEIVSDYMATYDNYYGIAEGSERWDVITEDVLEPMMRQLVKEGDLQSADFGKAAEEWLASAGMTQAEIDALRERIS